MKLMRRRQWRPISLVVATTAVITAVACSDFQEQPSAPIMSKRISNASGDVQSALWLRTSAGMQLVTAGTSHVVTSTDENGKIRTEVTAQRGPSQASANTFSSARKYAATAQDSAAAITLRKNISAATFIGSAGSATAATSSRAQWSPGKSSLKFRKVASRTVNGQTMSIAVAPGKTKGQPAQALSMSINDRVVTIIESEFAYRGHAWKSEMTRTMLFDSTGKVSAIADMDMRAMVTQPSVSTNSSAQPQAGLLARLIGRVVESIQPDALYAATPQLSNDCGDLLDMLNDAYDAQIAAYNALTIPMANYNTIYNTIHACIRWDGHPCLEFDDPTLYADLMAQLASTFNLIQTLGNAYNSAIAWYNTVYAAYVLCLYSDGPPHHTDTVRQGPYGECNNWWCEYTIWYDYFGNVDHIVPGPCWCGGFDV